MGSRTSDWRTTLLRAIHGAPWTSAIIHFQPISTPVQSKVDLTTVQTDYHTCWATAWRRRWWRGGKASNSKIPPLWDKPFFVSRFLFLVFRFSFFVSGSWALARACYDTR